MAEPIRAKVEAGLTAQRIYQDIKLEAGVAGSYQAVKRFVRQLKYRLPPQVWRVEASPARKPKWTLAWGPCWSMPKATGGAPGSFVRC